VIQDGFADKHRICCITGPPNCCRVAALNAARYQRRPARSVTEASLASFETDFELARCWPNQEVINGLRIPSPLRYNHNSESSTVVIRLKLNLSKTYRVEIRLLWDWSPAFELEARAPPKEPGNPFTPGSAGARAMYRWVRHGRRLSLGFVFRTLLGVVLRCHLNATKITLGAEVLSLGKYGLGLRLPLEVEIPKLNHARRLAHRSHGRD
jgi:hypothetical protein